MLEVLVTQGPLGGVRKIPLSWDYLSHGLHWLSEFPTQSPTLIACLVMPFVLLPFLPCVTSPLPDQCVLKSPLINDCDMNF